MADGESATNTVNESIQPVAPGGPTVVINDKIPEDKVNLRLLLVSGKRTDVMVSPSDTVDAVRKRAFEIWPREWAEEAPEAPANLRILYHGRILDNATTIEANKIPAGQTTVVHALIKAGVQLEGG
ncbi:Ubiquitin-like protein 3, partial [Borealophlyctis nickersoniae]